MDRLSSYAARESESEPQEDRKKTEEEATTRLLEKLKVSEEPKATAKKETAEAKAPNGDQANGDESVRRSAETAEDQTLAEPEPPAADGQSDQTHQGRNRGIPENVKLYEIFYEQVTNLVNAQRLHIHDTIALLVSLSNLALYVPSAESVFVYG